MKKENIKHVAILLCFASIVSVFAACSKEAQNNGAETSSESTVYVPSEFKTEKEKFYTDENGKLYYREDSEADGYELVTDENGVTVVDKDGNMIQKVTDADGKEATRPVSFPTFINEGNTIACQQFVITLPDGWASSGNVNLMFRNETEGKQINYSFVEKGVKNYKTTAENIAFLKESLKSMTEDGTAVIEEGTAQVAGRDAVKLTVETKDANPSYMEVYYVETEKGTMTFTCICKPADKGFDFNAILNTIQYRIQ